MRRRFTVPLAAVALSLPLTLITAGSAQAAPADKHGSRQSVPGRLSTGRAPGEPGALPYRARAPARQPISAP